MSYPITGLFSTNYRMALMLAECQTVQELLEADDAAAALQKMTTYSEDEMPLPRVVVHSEGDMIRLKSDSTAGFVEAEHRLIGCEFFVYIPDDENIERIMDEHNYVMGKMGDVVEEMIALSGTGTPLAGTTHLQVYDPVLYMPNRPTLEERFDHEEIERGDEARPLWYVLIAFEVH
jgi:hypothetical protein